MKKLFIFACMLLSASCMLTSCSDNNDATTTAEGEGGLKPIQIECSKVQQTPFAKQSNNFANKFFGMVNKEAKDKNANLCISPISMQYILSIYANGMADEDAKMILDLLDLGTLDQVNENNSQLLNLLNEDDEYVKVAMANGLWQQMGKNDVVSSFSEKIQRYYQADTKEANFNEIEETKNAINHWASEKTGGRIADVNINLHKYSFTQLAWVNATTFDAKWTQPFNGADTKKASFTNIDGTISQVDMMSTVLKNTKMYWNKDAEAIELPYGKGYFSMIVVIPHEVEKLDSIIANTDWWAMHEQMTEKKTWLHMPKFAISTDLTSLLGDIGNDGRKWLKALGLPEDINTGMAKATNPARELMGISQSTSIVVKENGTKASSASSGNDGMYFASTPPYEINRPFFFAIRENTTGTILYMGKVVRL